ncbi:class A beta-lactamase-related serine hydrolase [Oceanobacillus piezotolerans]|uniref:Class A beta-lactamase-related serine hydrolase n=1 Tax=Oceanobacillus piezotolerans TaxID=2448030 RepID=A0A498DBB2_9BACI|nr:serine hydrolase domain-containing protein [Oceanobacillus piezotolerans]RLL46974.1 class A beta-lactamase-related serine hydrolase [Oceanobacillus piezotolerans]
MKAVKCTFIYGSISVLLASALLIHPAGSVFADTTSFEPSIEKETKKDLTSHFHPAFSWGNQPPSSPVLHPGSIGGAGMIEGPLLKIDPVIQSFIESGTMPGAVTFVARRGHIVQHESYGYSYLYEDDKTVTDEPIEMKKDTIFDLASISKIFTTTAAMILYEDGHFQLDDPVADYIPEFAENGKEEVTIRQLMTHTSGFTAWAPLYTIGENRDERLQYVFQYPLTNEPGKKYTYSDLNMITLGALVERLSGQGLDQFVYEKITQPLRMNDTMYNPPETLKQRIAATEYQPSTNRGLVWGQVHDENAWSLDGVAGHAGVFSTASDLAILAHMYVNEGRYGGKRILQPETVKLLTENQIPEFPGNEHGLGWELSQGWYMDALSEASSIGHTGYTGTSIVINQSNDTIAILLTNRVHPSRQTVSTNPARQQFARLVADAIPVSTPNNKNAWFSGYGDRLNKTLTAEVEIDKASTLSFNTWYRIEQGYDNGIIEVSNDGENWNAINRYTGSSLDWKTEEFTLPADTTHIRFRYVTDGGVNGRGWYVTNVRLNGTPLDLVSKGWEERNH